MTNRKKVPKAPVAESHGMRRFMSPQAPIHVDNCYAMPLPVGDAGDNMGGGGTHLEIKSGPASEHMFDTPKLTDGVGTATI